MNSWSNNICPINFRLKPELAVNTTNLFHYFQLQPFISWLKMAVSILTYLYTFSTAFKCNICWILSIITFLMNFMTLMTFMQHLWAPNIQDTIDVYHYDFSVILHGGSDLLGVHICIQSRIFDLIMMTTSLYGYSFPYDIQDLCLLFFRHFPLFYYHLFNIYLLSHPSVSLRRSVHVEVFWSLISRDSA